MCLFRLCARSFRILPLPLPSLRASLCSSPTTHAALSAWPTGLAPLHHGGRGRRKGRSGGAPARLRLLLCSLGYPWGRLVLAVAGATVCAHARCCGCPAGPIRTRANCLLPLACTCPPSPSPTRSVRSRTGLLSLKECASAGLALCCCLMTMLRARCPSALCPFLRYLLSVWAFQPIAPPPARPPLPSS